MVARSDRSAGDFALVLAVASGSTISAAARAARVSPRTATRRLQEEGIQHAIAEARTAMHERVVGLVAAAADAVLTLKAVIKKAKATDPAKIRAAVAILEPGPRLRSEVELASRVDAIEEAIRTRAGPVSLRPVSG